MKPLSAWRASGLLTLRYETTCMAVASSSRALRPDCERPLSLREVAHRGDIGRRLRDADEEVSPFDEVRGCQARGDDLRDTARGRQEKRMVRTRRHHVSVELGTGVGGWEREADRPWPQPSDERARASQRPARLARPPHHHQQRDLDLVPSQTLTHRRQELIGDAGLQLPEPKFLISRLHADVHAYA